MALLGSFRRSIGRHSAAVALGLSLAVAMVGAPSAVGSAQVGGADVVVGHSFLSVWGPSVVGANVNVQNVGPAVASGVVVTFTVPDGAALVSGEQMTFAGNAATTDRLPCDVAADRRALTCTMPSDLAQTGGLVASAVVANAGLAAGSTIDVRVEVSAAVADPDPSNNVRDLPVTFSGPAVPLDLADLALSLPYPPVSGEDPAIVGVSFDLAYTGPAPATDIQVTVRAPAGVVVAPRTWSGSGPLTCPLAEPTAVLVCTMARYDRGGNIPIPVGVSVINVGLPAGSRIDVEASVTHAQLDPTPDDHLVTVPVTFAGGPVPTIAGESTAQLVLRTPHAPQFDPQPPVVADGRVVVFHWEVFSSGPAPASQVRWVLTLGPGMTLLPPFSPWGPVACTSRADPAAAAGAVGVTFDCVADRPLLAGSTFWVSLRASFDASPGTTLWSEAHVASERTDPVPADNHAVQRVVVPVPGGAPSSTAAPAVPTSIPIVSDAALPATGRPTVVPVVAAAGLLGLGLALRAVAGRTRQRSALPSSSPRPGQSMRLR